MLVDNRISLSTREHYRKHSQGNSQHRNECPHLTARGENPAPKGTWLPSRDDKGQSHRALGWALHL